MFRETISLILQSNYASPENVVHLFVPGLEQNFAVATATIGNSGIPNQQELQRLNNHELKQVGDSKRIIVMIVEVKEIDRSIKYTFSFPTKHEVP